jgi:toxin ParE1/3/4
VPKPLILRELAQRDIEEGVDFYLAEAGEAVAIRFIDAVEATFRAIRAHPAAGSPRHAHELALPGLRARQTPKFPFLIFYLDGNDQIDVWRVLNAARDLPAWLQEP